MYACPPPNILNLLCLWLLLQIRFQWPQQRLNAQTGDGGEKKCIQKTSNFVPSSAQFPIDAAAAAAVVVVAAVAGAGCGCCVEVSSFSCPSTLNCHLSF